MFVINEDIEISERTTQRAEFRMSTSTTNPDHR